MRRLQYGVLLGAFLLFVSCSYLMDYADIARQKGALSDNYRKILANSTRSQTVYSEFETMVKITATWKNDAFNRAYLDEYARIYGLRQEEKKVREGVQTDLAGDFMEFFFYAYTPEKSKNDFDRPQPSWTVFLQDGGGNRIDPVEIRRVDKITPVVEIFYPYVNQYYGSSYRLKFAAIKGAPEGSKDILPLTLVFTGVVGRVELRWER